MYWILDAEGQPIAAEGVRSWSAWFCGADRVVACDFVGDIRVSTVFLGIDYNFSGHGAPTLWESLVFGGALDGQMSRYDSLQSAEKGHRELLRSVKGIELVDNL